MGFDLDRFERAKFVPRIKLSELRTGTPTPELFRVLLPFITED